MESCPLGDPFDTEDYDGGRDELVPGVVWVVVLGEDVGLVGEPGLQVVDTVAFFADVGDVGAG